MLNCSLVDLVSRVFLHDPAAGGRGIEKGFEDVAGWIDRSKESIPRVKRAEWLAFLAALRVVALARIGGRVDVEEAFQGLRQCLRAWIAFRQGAAPPMLWANPVYRMAFDCIGPDAFAELPRQVMDDWGFGATEPRRALWQTDA